MNPKSEPSGPLYSCWLMTCQGPKTLENRGKVFAQLRYLFCLQGLHGID